MRHDGIALKRPEADGQTIAEVIRQLPQAQKRAEAARHQKLSENTSGTPSPVDK